jgi:exosortase/archaeosortase family protein
MSLKKFLVIKLWTKHVKLLQVFAQIPPLVKNFLIRALVIFIVWKMLYHLLLFPLKMPDKQLTNLTASTTVYLYQSLFNETMSIRPDVTDVNFYKANLYMNEDRVIGIADPCNGLELMALHVGFTFCFPIRERRRLAFATVGIIAIFIANCFRCFALAWLSFHSYSMVNFAHHYLFTMIIYAMIFYAWVIYTKKYFLNAA